jgi:hypothetical protein
MRQRLVDGEHQLMRIVASPFGLTVSVNEDAH